MCQLPQFSALEFWICPVSGGSLVVIVLRNLRILLMRKAAQRNSRANTKKHEKTFAVPRSAFGLESNAEFRQSFHRPRQNSFVAARHDRSLYQFGVVGHDPD